MQSRVTVSSTLGSRSGFQESGGSGNQHVNTQAVVTSSLDTHHQKSLEALNNTDCDHKKQGQHFNNEENIQMMYFRQNSPDCSSLHHQDSFKEEMPLPQSPTIAKVSTSTAQQGKKNKIAKHLQLRNKLNQNFIVEVRLEDSTTTLENHGVYSKHTERRELVEDCCLIKKELSDRHYASEISIETNIIPNKKVNDNKNNFGLGDADRECLAPISSESYAIGFSKLSQSDIDLQLHQPKKKGVILKQNNAASASSGGIQFSQKSNHQASVPPLSGPCTALSFTSQLPNQHSISMQLNNSPLNDTSAKRMDFTTMKSGFIGITNDPASDIAIPDAHQNRRQSQAVKNGGGNSGGVFSLKFLISIKPKLRRFMMHNTLFGRRLALNNKIRAYIGDSVDDIKSLQHKGMASHLVESLLDSLEKLFKCIGLDKIPLFDPESKMKIILNSIIVSYNLFYMVLITLILIFEAHPGNELEHIFHYIAMASWITEMVVEMNTACYHNNHFITDRKVIIQIYSKEYFFFEILPLIFEGRTSENTLYNVLLHLPLLLKIKGMSIILAKLEFYILQILEQHYIFQLFKLIMQMLLYGHIVACCWYLIVKIEGNLLHSVSWVEASKIELNSWWQVYLLAQYWAFSVMMNVTTIPTTPIELGFTSLIMLLSCIAFGYLLSTIAGIIDELNKQQKDYKKDLNILNSYMKRKKVDLGTKRRVNIDLMTYYKQKSRDNLQVEQEALLKLSGDMFHELNVQANSRIIKQFPFLSKIFTEQSIVKMYSMLEEEVYAPQQTILMKRNDHYLYLIIKGEVSIQIEQFIAPVMFGEESDMIVSQEKLDDGTISVDKQWDPNTYQEEKFDSGPCLVRKQKTVEDPVGAKKSLTTLKSGQIFGAFAFFTGSQQAIECHCKDYTTIVKINRKKFLDIVKDTRRDHEKFCEIKDKMINRQIADEIPEQQCIICGFRDHLFEQCHFGHFNKANSIHFFKNNYSVPQERVQQALCQVERRPAKHISARWIIANLLKCVIDIREKLGIDLSSDDNEDDDYEEEEEEEGEDYDKFDDQIENDGGDSQLHMCFSEGRVVSSTKRAKKTVSKFVTAATDDENSKLLFSTGIIQPGGGGGSSSMSPLSKHYKQFSENDIPKLEDDVNKFKPLPYSVGNIKPLDEDIQASHSEDINLMPNVSYRSPNGNRRNSFNRQTNPRKSLVKFSDNPGGVTNNGGMRRQGGNSSGQQLLSGDQQNVEPFIKKRHSYISSASPLIGSVAALQFQPAIDNFNLQHNYHASDGAEPLQQQKRRSFIQPATAVASTASGGGGGGSSHHFHGQQGQKGVNQQQHSHQQQHQHQHQTYHGGSNHQSSYPQQQSNYLMNSQRQIAAGDGGTPADMLSTVLTKGSVSIGGGGGRGNLLSSQQINRVTSGDYRKSITMNVMTMQLIDDHRLIWGMDKQRDFPNYFPYFNCSNVLRRKLNYQTISTKNRKVKAKKIADAMQGKESKRKQKTQQPLLAIGSIVSLSNSRVSSFNRINSATAKTQKTTQTRQQHNELSLNIISADLFSKTPNMSNINLLHGISKQ